MFAVAGLFILLHFRSQVPRSPDKSAERPLAPGFSLPDRSGARLSLSDYRGKVVLLDFWATWCEPCRQEIPHFVDLQNKYGPQGLQVLGVSMDDSMAPVQDFYRQLKMNYPVVLGNAKVGELYGGILGLPVAYLIGRDGRIRAKYTGAADISALETAIQHLLSSSERAALKPQN
ncbi:MAG TPA: TlpA disulfide reductase family protein [Verrucomicrobiae bacterium]|nr:TlpA disulfide reductase family protein [Verrucomicrobiae bacterium]